MPRAHKNCKGGHHRRSVTRSICVKNKVARVCKYGARGAGGKCPKVPRAARSDMRGLMAKYPNAFKAKRGSAATKIQSLLRGKFGRRRGSDIKGAGGLAAMKGHFGY